MPLSIEIRHVNEDQCGMKRSKMIRINPVIKKKVPNFEKKNIFHLLESNSALSMFGHFR